LAARGIKPDVPELGPMEPHAPRSSPRGGGGGVPVGVLFDVGTAAIQSDNPKEFAGNVALNIGMTLVPELGGVTGRTEGEAVFGILMTKYVAPAVVKHVIVPLASNPLTWVVVAEAGIIYLMYMDKNFVGDQKRADRAIKEYQAGRNINAFCDQCHGAGGALDERIQRSFRTGCNSMPNAPDLPPKKDDREALLKWINSK